MHKEGRLRAVVNPTLNHYQTLKLLLKIGSILVNLWQNGIQLLLHGVELITT